MKYFKKLVEKSIDNGRNRIIFYSLLEKEAELWDSEVKKKFENLHEDFKEDALDEAMVRLFHYSLQICMYI